VKKLAKVRKQIYQYTAVFEPNEDGGFTVTIPALPGLVTEGRNFEEARQMAEDAIECYIGGLRKLREEVPEEREPAILRLTVTA
jgi:predicted RNase H-like HicB family nuclease